MLVLGGMMETRQTQDTETKEERDKRRSPGRLKRKDG
jgi:hypothetical protein